MSTPDRLLVCWWALAVIVGLFWLVVAWRVRAGDRAAAVASYLKGDATGRYRVRTVMAAVPRPVAYALIVASVLLLVGAVAFVWMAHWTNLLLANRLIEGALFGALVAAFGLSSEMFAKLDWQWLRSSSGVMRALLAVIGAGVTAICIYALVADYAFPRSVVTGRVARATTVRDRLFSPTYVIVIDGKRYRTTHQVFAHVAVGDEVRAELGAGSRMLLRTDPITD